MGVELNVSVYDPLTLRRYVSRKVTAQPFGSFSVQDLTAASDVFKGDVKNESTDTLVQMQQCPKPIIGAINGHCITAGFEIALGCDILLASNNAKFIDTHAK